MKYDHRVKVDGKWFDAGVEVNSSAPVNKEPKAEPPKTEESPSEASDEGYSRTQIQQMNKTALVETAEKLGIEVTEDITNNELKGKIFAKLGI